MKSFPNMPAPFAKWSGRLLVALVASCWLHSSALGEKRVALVIGNSTYQHTPPLINPTNDAVDMAATLSKNFSVIQGLNLSKSDMDRLIVQFAEALTGSDVGIFFYAGHGLQLRASTT
jgi:uncharacterized caspase-like protein